MQPPTNPRLREFAVIGLVSASMLMHQILLTRVCALRLQFHFAFLIISNCLLGLGAAGTLLMIKQEVFRARPAVWLGRFTLGYLASLIATYLLLLRVPLPLNVELSRLDHILALSAFNLLGAVPFLFTGLVIGFLLSLHASRGDRLYAVDLVCAAGGCMAVPMLLPLVGGGGVFVAEVLLAVVAAMIASRQEFGRKALVAGAVLVVLGLVLLPSFDRMLPVPSKPAHVPPLGGERLVYSVWTANSRIDLTMHDGCKAPMFMLGTKALGRHPRECAEIAQDATAGTTISNFSSEPAALDILRDSMYSTAYRLKQAPSVLVIGLGGGNDVWSAKANGARSVKAIELNWPIVDIHRRLQRHWSRTLVEDPTVEFVVDEGRSALMREQSKYDVVQMTGIDTWTALASGAYVLAENYLYTREAIASMYDHLAPDGIIQISRFAAAMETLRLLSNIHAALADFGVNDLEHSIMATATPDFMLSIQLKKGRFSDEEQASTLAFAEANGIAMMYLPNRPAPGPIDEFMRTSDRAAMIESFPWNIAPTDDDQPYFFNFTKWSDPIDSLEHIHDIPAISQGNPFFILTQLAVSIVLSLLLIVWPLARQGGVQRAGALRLSLFFSALGAGFIAIEVTVIQKLTLLLGQPVYSLTVTLFSLLIFTGLGSMHLARRIKPGTLGAWAVPVLLVLYLGAINLGSPLLVDALIAEPLPARIGASVLMLAPLGLLLGIPFAFGLRVTDQFDPRLTPWAWAVNGCMSVVGSILTVVVSMNLGFSAVLWLSAAIYLGGFAALNGLRLGAAAG